MPLRFLFTSTLILFLLQGWAQERPLNEREVRQTWDDTLNQWVTNEQITRNFDLQGRILGTDVERQEGDRWMVTYRSYLSYFGEQEVRGNWLRYSYSIVEDTLEMEKRRDQNDEQGNEIYRERTRYQLLDNGDSILKYQYITQTTRTYFQDSLPLREEVTSIRFDTYRDDSTFWWSENSYNADGCLAKTLTAWNEETTFERGANCQLIRSVYIDRDGGGGITDSVVQTYDAGGNLAERVEYRDNFSSNGLLPFRRDVYYTSGDTAYHEIYDGNDSTREWYPEPYDRRGSVVSTRSDGATQTLTFVNMQNDSVYVLATRIIGPQINLQKNVSIFKATGDTLLTYLDEQTYDEKGRILTNRRNDWYDEDIENFRATFIISTTYRDFPNQVLSTTDRIVNRWNFGINGYTSTYSTTSRQVDYHCNGLIKMSKGTGTGMSRTLYTYDRSATAECETGGNPVITLSPNPVRDILTVRAEGVNRVPTEIDVIAMDGRRVIHKPFDYGSYITTVDVSSLSEGTYMVRIAKNGEATYHKFIKVAD